VTASEGFRVRVRTAKTPTETFLTVSSDFDPTDPEVAIHADEFMVVYDSTDGDHRVQGVIEVQPEPAGGSLVVYGLAIEFGGIIARFGPIRRRMAALIERGMAEELVADLDGVWV